MSFPPLLRQLFVVSGPQLAGVSLGGCISFPSVLFPQLKANDSTIQLDIHTASWIGSTRGLAGVCTCLVPLLMQYKGRKLTYILSCLLGLIGWIIVYFAQSAVALIVAECFHGLSGSSMLSCNLQTISEMVHPKYRIISMNISFLTQSIGLNLIIWIGRYFTWRTVGLIECCPLILSLLIGFAWPESPAWLAYKGEFDKCEVAFKWLRDTSPDSEKELNELITAQKESLAERKARTPLKFNKNCCRFTWLKVSQRDFYLPCLHSFMLLCCVYWSGFWVMLIYTMDILQQVTGSESTASIGVTVIYSIFFFANVLGLILAKKCKNKTILTIGGVGVCCFMMAACIVSYLQEYKVLPQDSNLCFYCLVGYMASFSLGSDICFATVAAELMPIKHRGVGGVFYMILINLLDFSSLKLSPYLFSYIKPWGTFLVFTVNAILCMLFIWRYVPETKNRTLQQIEDFYNYGHFLKRSTNDCALENIKDSCRED